MRNSLLPFSPPLIGEEEIAEVVDTLRSGWISTGPKVKQFEQEFATFLDAPAALALSSCTAALHVALAALGIGAGDAVITTPIAFCSSVHVIEQVGARPILVDVEPDTLNMDPWKVRAAIEESIKAGAVSVRIKAILPVHLYGHPYDMEAIMEIAREFKLAVIEDAAHALPAKYKGRTIGSEAFHSEIPVVTCFSFYATKNLTTAEGGMLVGPVGIVEDARIWGLHGISRNGGQLCGSDESWCYEVIRPGFKYNMSDIHAAIGIHQLRKLSGFHSRRREIVRQYNAAFSQMNEFRIPVQRPEVEHAWHLYALRLEPDRWTISRNQFIAELRLRNIAASVHFMPVHMHPYFAEKYGYKPEDFPVAFRAFQGIVSLPLYPNMSNQDVNDVIEAVQDVVEACKERSTSDAGRT